MSDILDNLKGGDWRSIGRSDEVVAEVLDIPSLFDDLFSGMQYNDPQVRMRSADLLQVTQILEEQTRTGSPALKSRGRKMIVMLSSS